MITVTFTSAVLGGGYNFLYELFLSIYIYCALNILLHITILQVEVCWIWHNHIEYTIWSSFSSFATCLCVVKDVYYSSNTCIRRNSHILTTLLDLILKERKTSNACKPKWLHSNLKQDCFDNEIVFFQCLTRLPCKYFLKCVEEVVSQHMFSSRLSKLLNSEFPQLLRELSFFKVFCVGLVNLT